MSTADRTFKSSWSVLAVGILKTSLLFGYRGLLLTADCCAGGPTWAHFLLI